MILNRTLRHWQGIILACVIAMAIVEWLLIAWVHDDAFISFRVVDNFVHGYGLRWNIHERVQVFTNPLWMLLHIPFYAVWPNIYLITLILSFVCTASALALTMKTWPRPPLVAASFLLLLMTCFSFAIFTSSGLETPLSYLLFTIFGWACFRQHEKQWFRIGLFAALAIINRMDTALICAIPIAFLLIRDTRRKTLRLPQLLPGILLVAAWAGFALFYYGFLFPNTKYAKLGSGWSVPEYMTQGGHYFQSFMKTDWVGFAIMILGIFYLAINLYRAWRKSDEGAALTATFLIGAASYCGYILYVGGDFILNRFFALPVFVVAWCLYKETPGRFTIWMGGLVGVLLVCLLTGHLSVSAAIARTLPYFEHGIGNEHGFYSPGNSLIDQPNRRIRTRAEFSWANFGRQFSQGDPNQPLILGGIGMQGFYAGPRIRIIDFFAIGDPLLARLPARPVPMRIAHFERAIPQGYPQAFITGDASEMSPDLGKYYEKLRLIVSGDLWDRERWKTIVLFNLGYYDNWRDGFLATHPEYRMPQ